MPETRTCVDCGDKYVFDAIKKKGATTRCCSSCARRNAKEETKRQMLQAAGGSCRCCGYKKSLSAITFIDPIARLTKPKDPVNRTEKIAWASERIALCLNCVAEVNSRYVKMHIEDVKARPPKVFFATDVATIVQHYEPNKNTSVSIPSKELDFEVLPPEK